MKPMYEHEYIISIEISLDNGHVIKKNYTVADSEEEANDMAEHPIKEFARFIYENGDYDKMLDFTTPDERENISIPMSKITHIATKFNINYNFYDM